MQVIESEHDRNPQLRPVPPGGHRARLGRRRAQRGRRMVLNVMVVNRDDHAKNLAFLRPEGGDWRLAPAYDVTHACPRFALIAVESDEHAFVP
ncbi:MAG: HipA domain-containing protein [Acidimicrobiales bacterium]